MHKLLVFITVFLALGVTLARQDKDRSYFERKEPSWIHRKLLKFCSNKTIAQAYLTQIISVIDGLQANSSDNSILKSQSKNFITYLKNTTNQELLRSDCEAFIKGLMAAKKADQTVQHVQKHLANQIQNQIEQVARDVTNGKGFQELKY